MHLHLLLCYSSLLWFLLPRSFCASPDDPQRELNMWLSINRACLITSIGHGNNVGIKAEQGARMWHIIAAGFSGTDLIQSGSLIWRSLNQSWRREPFEERSSGAALVWWNMDIWIADVWRDANACWWHLTCLLWIKATQRERHTGWIVMTGLRHHVDSELVFLQVFDISAKSGKWTAAPAHLWP